MVALLSLKQSNNVGVAAIVAAIGGGIIRVILSEIMHPPESLTNTVYDPADKPVNEPLDEKPTEDAPVSAYS
jgi:hypothetical protein